MKHYLLVNFGGPRNLEEVAPFLQALLCDRDVIRTRFPNFIHNFLFSRIARKRSVTVAEDYQEIGGCSPIYNDTENLAKALSEKLNAPVLTFHRYLPSTHKESLEKINAIPNLTVIPLFPQFCYATTGSIARFFSTRVSSSLQWVKSYPAHPAFIRATERRIGQFLIEKNLDHKDTVLLFSAHGIPQTFIDLGDIYKTVSERSFTEVLKAFPKTLGKLCYQSKFGRGEWLRPYTNEVCEDALNWNKGRKNVVFIPISFTSDHIETLFEIEKLYLPVIQTKNLNAYRCPSLNLEPYWIEALAEIAQDTNLSSSQMLYIN